MPTMSIFLISKLQISSSPFFYLHLSLSHHLLHVSTQYQLERRNVCHFNLRTFSYHYPSLSIHIYIYLHLYPLFINPYHLTTSYHNKFYHCNICKVGNRIIRPHCLEKGWQYEQRKYFCSKDSFFAQRSTAVCGHIRI